MSRWHLNQQHLAMALTQAAKVAAAHIAKWNSGLPDTQSDRSFAEAHIIHEAGKSLLAALSDVEPFSAGAGFLVARPNGYEGFHAAEATRELVRRVLADDPRPRLPVWAKS